MPGCETWWHRLQPVNMNLGNLSSNEYCQATVWLQAMWRFDCLGGSTGPSLARTSKRGLDLGFTGKLARVGLAYALVYVLDVPLMDFKVGINHFILRAVNRAC